MARSKQERIKFFPDQKSGYDELGGSSPVAMNVIIDGNGTVRRRPGITNYLSKTINPDSKTVQALQFSSATGSLYAFTSTLPGTVNAYRVTTNGTVNLGLLGSFPASKRPVIAETEAMLAIAVAKEPYYLSLFSESVLVLGGTPPIASHVIANNARLLMNNIQGDKGRINYSGPSTGSSITGHEQWGAQITDTGQSGLYLAESRPDPVVALVENSNEVFALGSTNFQLFAPDANLVYSSVSTREYGCSTPYAVIRDDQNFAWMDDKRRIIHTDGRTVKVISDPIKQTLDDLVTVKDAFGYRVSHGATDALVFTFPSDGRTFAYQKNGGWSQWSTLDPITNNFALFPVNAHTFVPGTNANIVGLNSGAIGMMRADSNTDLGVEIPAYVTTGFEDRGTDSRKQCISVRLALKRGAQATNTEPRATISFRDDQGSWGSEIDVSLGLSGDTHPVVEKRSLGVYRRRQWRFKFYGTEDFALVSATEEYKVLGN